MKHYFNTAAMRKIWVDLVIIWWKLRKCYCERSELYAPLCKEKVDLNIQVYNTVQQGLTFLVRICCEECRFLPLSLVILMHPTTLYSYSSVWLPGLKKLHQFQQESANNFSIIFPIRGQAVLVWCVKLVDILAFAEGGVTILRSVRLRFLFLRL